MEISITYAQANKIAEKCENNENLICKVRDKYRDCDRPLCCGFCPTVDNCENVCKIIEDNI